MPWHQISVVTNEATAPKLADCFSELGAVSVTYMDADDEPVYEPAIGETKIWSRTRVISLYELSADPVKLKTQVSESFKQEPLSHWAIEKIEDQVWEHAWMEHYRPMKFAEKLWVCPSGQECEEENTVCLILDPGLAFGTGTHPTTALCLEWLASHDLRDKTVIDYGCGSGILAIAAVLLGAKKACAIDIDPQAITATLVNAEKNQVQDKVFAYHLEQFQQAPVKADIVLANILAKPLITLSAQLSGLLSPQGQLVLSGILVEQTETVLNAYKPYLSLDDNVQQADWVRLSGSFH